MALRFSRHFRAEIVEDLRVLNPQTRYGTLQIISRFSVRTTSHPASVKELLDLWKQVFSTEYVRQLSLTFEWLVKHLSANVANEYIRLRTYDKWLEGIVNAMYNSEQQLRSTPFNDPQFSSLMHAQLDGSIGPSASQTPEIIQLNLVGKTLRSAWIAHCRDGNTRLGHQQPQEWDTAAPSSAVDCFHGVAPSGLDVAALHQLTHRQIHVTGNENQMAPWGCFHTSFAAVRSFTWAVFVNEIETNNLYPANTTRLNHSWQVDGQLFTGVIVMNFKVTIPAANADVRSSNSHHGDHANTLQQTSAILHQDQMERWTDQVTSRYGDSNSIDLGKAGLWNELEPIHHQPRPMWPDRLHAPEVQTIHHSLRGWTGNTTHGLLQLPMWRTAHCSPSAVRSLNSGPTWIYAITFSETPTFLGSETLYKAKSKFGK